MVPIKDRDTLKVYWVLPYAQKDYKSKPLEYWSHLFGHKGKNSLLSFLKKEGYALALSAGGDAELNIYSDFDVTVDLTEKGKDNIDNVLQIIFKYAKTVSDAGPTELVFEELRKTGQMNFDFAAK
jgi:secreted Zn-dependent insulinase-like peptidase